ncbi:MAG TPA: HEPN domain-containing protein [Phycisphaerae bacterium]|nr:HEPN domain-containing protein [Phycisphaerae bacterium]
MTPRDQVKLLLDKARQDEALVDEVLGAPHISDEIVGFHCQQAAEKLLKALLTACGVAYERTHNLRRLTDLLSDAGQTIPRELQDIDSLTPFAVLLRYIAPGPSAPLDRPVAREMVRTLRTWVESELRKTGV